MPDSPSLEERRARRQQEREKAAASGDDALAKFRAERDARKARREQMIDDARAERFVSRRGRRSEAMEQEPSSAPAPSSSGSAAAAASASPAAQQRADKAGALTFRQLVNLFLSVGVDHKTAGDIIEGNADIANIAEDKADLFKQVLRDALQILEAEGVPQNVFSSRVEETAAAGKTETVRIRTNLCKVCKDAAAIQATYPEVMNSYFRRYHRFRGELTKDDWLCRGCYGNFYGDNLDFVKEVQHAEESQRRRLIAEEMAKSQSGIEEDSDSDSDEDDDVAHAKRIQKELFLKTIAYPLYVLTKSIDEKALQHRKYLVRAVTLGRVRLVQLPAALKYLRKNASVVEEDFEHACGIGRYAEVFGWVEWRNQDTVTEILKLDAAARAKAKAEKHAERHLIAESERKERDAIAAEAEKERERIALRRQREREVEDGSIAERRAKLAAQRATADDKKARDRKKADDERVLQKDQAAELRKRNDKKRAQELKTADEKAKEQERVNRNDRDERARKVRRQREETRRKFREQQAELDKQFAKEAAARREQERERRKTFA